MLQHNARLESVMLKHNLRYGDPGLPGLPYLPVFTRRSAFGLTVAGQITIVPPAAFRCFFSCDP